MEKTYKSKMTSTSSTKKVKTTSPENKSFYGKLAGIAGLQNDGNWEIYDSDEDAGLFLLHSKIEPKISGLPRGVVVDVENEVVICDSFGFTPVVPLDVLRCSVNTEASKSLPDNLDISVVDEFINRHTFKYGSYVITPAYEGVVVRAFKHGGKVYYSTHKRLNCSRSRWGNSDYFLDIYKRLGGPKSEEMFPEDVKTSPWCYNFLLADRELQYATKQRIGAGFIVDLGRRMMWSYGENCPYEDVGTEHLEPFIPEGLENLIKFEGREETLLVKPKRLSLEEANEFMRCGYGDEKELCGEAVILYQFDENERVVDSVRVQPGSYNRRCQIRGDNPNIRHRFYQLINDALRYEHRGELLKKYPLFLASDGKTDSISINHDNHLVKLNMKNVDDRIFLVYVHFYDTLPYSQQSRGRELWEDFKRDRQNIISWFQHLSEESNPEGYIREEYGEDAKFSSRAKAILDMTKKHAVTRMSTGKDRNRYGKKMSQDQLVKANIYNLLRRENGPSLFKLIREMKRFEKIKESVE